MSSGTGFAFDAMPRHAPPLPPTPTDDVKPPVPAVLDVAELLAAPAPPDPLEPCVAEHAANARTINTAIPMRKMRKKRRFMEASLRQAPIIDGYSPFIASASPPQNGVSAVHSGPAGEPPKCRFPGLGPPGAEEASLIVSPFPSSR